MAVRISKSSNQRGYILLSVMLLMTLMLLAMTIEAPRIVQQIKREKEEELIHRGNEYKVAIKKFFRKFGRYPLSIEQLENTNNIRFLRKRYKDPITGKDDWRLLHPGEVQLSAGPGTNPNGQPSQQIGSSIGQTPTVQPAIFGTNSPTSNQPGQPVVGQAGQPPATQGPGIGSPATPGSTGITPASNMPGASGNSPVIGGGPIIGVASVSKLESIKIRDGKDHYNEWPFVYDPRQENNAQAGVPGTTQNPGGQMGLNPAGTNPGSNPGTGPGSMPGVQQGPPPTVPKPNN